MHEVIQIIKQKYISMYKIKKICFLSFLLMTIVFAPHSFSYCVIVLLPPHPLPPSTVPPAPPTPHVTPLEIKPIVPLYASVLYSTVVLDAWYQLSGKASSHNGVDHLNPTPSFLKGITVTVSSCPCIHLFRYCPQDIF